MLPQHTSPPLEDNRFSVDCCLVWAFYILPVPITVHRCIQNILLWLFTYSVVACVIYEMLKETKNAT